MNEQRLTEFGEQALEYAHANYIAGSDPHQWNVLYRKKFAELIVKECIAWVEDNNGHDGPSISEMKEHFGVEE